MIGAEGCAFIIRGEIVLLGITPTRLQIEGLAEWLSFNQREHLFSTERLSAAYAGASEFDKVVCGLLSVRIALGQPRLPLLWFRPPVTQVITCVAGDPDKPAGESRAWPGASAPRRSFEKWQQTFHDSSEQWTSIDRTFASALRPVIAETLFLRMNEEVLRLNLELARNLFNAGSYPRLHIAQVTIYRSLSATNAVRIYAQLVSSGARDRRSEPESRSFSRQPSGERRLLAWQASSPRCLATLATREGIENRLQHPRESGRCGI